MSEWVNKRAPVLISIIGTAAIILALVTGWLIYRGEDTRSIVTRSPCAINANSPECQKTKAASDKAQSIHDACITFKKVGYECPKVSKVREVRKDRHNRSDISGGTDRATGGGSSSGSSAPSSPSPPPSGGGGNGGPVVGNPPTSPSPDTSVLGPTLDGVNQGLENACNNVPSVASVHVC